MAPLPRGPVPDGTPRAVFGAMLRFYRIRAGLTQEQLAVMAHVSTALVSAYENSWRVPVRATVEIFDAMPELSADGALTELWDQLEGGMKYQGYPSWFQDWPEREATAKRIRWFEPNVVPGLMQTREYARAIFRSRVGVTDEEVDELVAARLKRQEIFLRSRPPEYWLIIDEAVLNRPVGGGRVMLEQLEGLLEAAQRPYVVLQVIPVSVGAHLGLLGAFALADFDDSPSFGYQEAALRGVTVDAAEDVALLDHTWATLGTDAERRAASLALLQEAAKKWTSPA